MSQTNDSPPAARWWQRPLARNLAAAAALFAAVGGLAWWSATSGGGAGGASQECRDRVELRLKAPSTADFQSSSTQELGGTGDRWEVAGIVDAENSFGGTVRMTYRCDLTYDEETGRWDAALVDVQE